MTKELMLGVDYADDVEASYQQGELGDTPLIARIMDNAVKAGMTSIAWRVSHVGTLTYRTRVGTVQNGMKAMRGSLTPFGLIMKRIDPLKVAVEEAHRRGLKIFVYHTLFDEAYTETTTGVVQESEFGSEHPECYSAHHTDGTSVRGVLSFGYPEVREYFANLVDEALSYDPDGVYLDVARTHAGANPIPVHGWWPQWTNPYLAYGYNEPDVARYRDRYGELPPILKVTDTQALELSQEEERWNRVRGEALTVFLREIRPLVKKAGKTLYMCFFPATGNGFNPGYQCRQMLGRYHIDWPTWVEEGLIDGIRLNIDHRRFGYDDWVAASAQTYREARDKGVSVIIDCAIESRYDEVNDPPKPLPIRKDEDPDAFFELMGTMIRKMLASSADGIAFYEHCSNDDRTWDTIAAAQGRRPPAAGPRRQQSADG